MTTDELIQQISQPSGMHPYYASLAVRTSVYAMEGKFKKSEPLEILNTPVFGGVNRGIARSQ
ncbi:MAG: hypothetical protein ACOY3I_10285 [Verrucomicrobiota bacterium]